jgi:hypothetical protein
VRERFGWDAVAVSFANICERVVREGRGGGKRGDVLPADELAKESGREKISV